MDEIHFNHWLPYFDNSSYDIVLNVYLPPASIERITIRMSNDNYHSTDSTTSSRTDTNALSDEPCNNIQSAAKTAGKIAGMGDAYQDSLTFNTADKESLPQRAKSASVKYVKERKDAIQENYCEATKIAEAFVEGYIKGYKYHSVTRDEHGKDVWPDEITCTAKKRARADKESDHSRNKSRSQKQIRYRAIAHALEHLGLDMIDDIEKFIEHLH